MALSTRIARVSRHPRSSRTLRAWLVRVDNGSRRILYARPMCRRVVRSMLRSARQWLRAAEPRSLERTTALFEPISALSDPLTAVLSAKELKDFTKDTSGDVAARLDTLWVFAAGALVMLMQAGFLLLEAGFSRMKNAGTVVAKVIANLSIAAVCYWAVGFALAFGGTGWFAGTEGTFLGTMEQSAFPAMEFSTAAVPAKFFFQFAFCAVSLAIVWGTTLERIKFGAYLIYAVIFSALIYPIISHWIFGGGWLQVNFGMQDFAGSTVIHLIGATGALAALLLLGPRQGKYGRDGSPNVIPGHNMPLMGLGVLILFF